MRTQVSVIKNRLRLMHESVSVILLDSGVSYNKIESF